MLDNDLIKAFYPILRSGFDIRGLNDYLISQSNQPTMQGAQFKGGIYFYKLKDYRYGFPFWRQRIVLDPPPGVIYQDTIQNYETTFQISAWSIQNPANDSSLTASDILNYASEIFSEDNTIQSLQAQNIGIIRITDVRNPYFKNEYDNWEASPSFDFTLLYQRSSTTQVPISQKINIGIYRV